MRTPTDDYKLYNTHAVSALSLDHYRNMQNFKRKAPAEFKKFLQLVWRESDGGTHPYGRDGLGFESQLKAAMDAAGVEIEGKLKKLAGGGVSRPTRTGSAPRISGGSAKLRPVAQEALNDLYGGGDPMDVVQFVVNQTAKYEPGYEPTGGFSDFSYIVGDKASEVIAIIRKVDPVAADELEEALTEVY
jgi:hypothetical protein